MMARESVVYEMALQQTVVLTVRASEHLPDPSLVTACAIEAIDHSDDSTETWPSTIAEATTAALTIHVQPPPASVVAGRRYTVRGTVSIGAASYPLIPCGLVARLCGACASSGSRALHPALRRQSLRGSLS